MDSAWHWWLTSTHEQIRIAGANPKNRPWHCGHRRSLPAWLTPSIGLWAVERYERIRSAIGVTAEARTLLDTTIHRHRLQDGLHARAAGWSPDDVMLYAWALIRGQPTDPGQAAEDLRQRWGRDGGPGILPIEALLYHLKVEAVLLTTNEDPREWAAMPRKRRVREWERRAFHVSIP